MTTTAQESNRDEAVRVGVQTRPDETLVVAAIGGDELAFEELVSRYRQAALRVAGGIAGSNQAEDVVQDALLLAHRALASLKDRTKFSRWLMAITRWRALRASRKERRHAFGHVPLDESVLETLSDLASSARQGDVGSELLVSALATIPPEYAEVIRYHFLHDLSHQKIAEFLDVPLSTVKWRCFRGKEILRCTLSSEPTCPTVCRKGCAKFPNEK
ncbi:MAG TPA: RNA polymerase sigma factor [Thermoanaerobaculia bacterium]|nr:RNA polymerase sigma factor [Thermoanaerobaculia bacterium]